MSDGERSMGDSGFEAKEPPTVRDIRREQLTKLWLRCPECRTVHELWPKEKQELDDMPENVLIRRVLDCWLSHDWTPDTWEEAHEQGLVPADWVDDSDNSNTDSDRDV